MHWSKKKMQNLFRTSLTQVHSSGDTAKIPRSSLTASEVKYAASQMLEYDNFHIFNESSLKKMSSY